MSKLKQIVDLYESGVTSPKAISAALKEKGVEASAAYVSSILSRHRKSKGETKPKASKEKPKPKPNRVEKVITAVEVGEIRTLKGEFTPPESQKAGTFELTIDVSKEQMESFGESITRNLDSVTARHLDSVACLWRCCDRNEDLMHAAIIRFMSMVS